MGRNDYGYDEEFDYAGSGMVAPDPRLFKVMPGTTGRRYVGKPVGECRLGDAASGVDDHVDFALVHGNRGPANKDRRKSQGAKLLFDPHGRFTCGCKVVTADGILKLQRFTHGWFLPLLIRCCRECRRIRTCCSLWSGLRCRSVRPAAAFRGSAACCARE